MAMVTRTIYGWTADGKWYLSPFSSQMQTRPRNEYATKEEAETEVKRRGVNVMWENG